MQESGNAQCLSQIQSGLINKQDMATDSNVITSNINFMPTWGLVQA